MSLQDTSSSLFDIPHKQQQQHLLNSSSGGSAYGAQSEDKMATANAVGTIVLLCTLALGVGAGCLAILRARSKYREYAVRSTTDDDREDLKSSMVTLYPAFPQQQQQQQPLCDEDDEDLRQQH